MSSAEREPGTRREIILDGDVRMALRWITSGEFRMGQRGEFVDEEPVHRVVIPEGFWLGETPVTQAQFGVWAAAEGIEHANHVGGRPDRPAENLSWHDAVGFCDWLSRTQELPEGMVASLPDEARWEHACRAGTDTEYWSGDGEAALAEVGWYEANSEESTHPVGAKPANPWGLHDMHGNVNEWCADAWDARAYRKRVDGWRARPWTLENAGQDAVFWDEKSPNRVLRGGSWIGTARHCRSAFRYRLWPSDRIRGIGFRVCLARSLPAEQQAGEPEPPGGVARRDDEAEPDGARPGEGRGIDLSRERLPRGRRRE